MSRSNAPLMIGGVAVAGIGYYVYSQGSSKVAVSQTEQDFDKAKANAQATIDSLKDSANSATEAGKRKLEEVQARAEAEYKNAKDNSMKKVDQFDAVVLEKAGQAKDAVTKSSWWGGSSK